MPAPFNFSVSRPSDPPESSGLHSARQRESLKRQGPGFATGPELAKYLRIANSGVRRVALERNLTRNRAGKYSWADIWSHFWQLHDVPPDTYAQMKAPLLKDADIAEMLGISAKSVRRDGSRVRSLYDLPRFLDLGTRGRRHHPEMITAWTRGLDTPPWLQARPRRRAGSTGAVLRARPRKQAGIK